MNTLNITLAIMIMAAMVTACSSDQNANDISSGIIIDSRIQNLNYESGELKGKTDITGSFASDNGSSINFEYAGLKFDDVEAKRVLTLNDLIKSKTIDNRVINLARLLQTLDTNPDNKVITLPTNLKTNLSQLRLEQGLKDFESDTTIQSVLSERKKSGLIDAQVAVNHLFDTVKHISLELDTPVDLGGIHLAFDSDGDGQLDNNYLNSQPKEENCWFSQS